uniref:SCP domain-containing protein n=1 Tax=Callorhinchus milii TaxID=7868 RepID=A0A4W3GHP1_CALMI
MAKHYAGKCIFQHNPKRKNAGENLMAILSCSFSTGRPVRDWYNEKVFYSHKNKRCDKGRACGHYTQMVWANTSQLGCATKFCPTLKNGGKKLNIVVCNYRPPGNLKGSGPYKQGPSCSECPSGYTCENKLCSKFIQDFAVEHQSKQNLLGTCSDILVCNVANVERPFFCLGPNPCLFSTLGHFS